MVWPRSRDYDHDLTLKNRDYDDGLTKKSSYCDYGLTMKNHDCNHRLTMKNCDCDHALTITSHDCYHGLAISKCVKKARISPSPISHTSPPPNSWGAQGRETSLITLAGTSSTFTNMLGIFWLAISFPKFKKINSEILVWHFRLKLAMILQWNALVFSRKILISTCSEHYDQYLTMRNHDFDHDAKGVIWVTIYIHIYKLRFTPAYNFY